jgi:hypothetical protein
MTMNMMKVIWKGSPFCQQNLIGSLSSSDGNVTNVFVDVL